MPQHDKPEPPQLNGLADLILTYRITGTKNLHDLVGKRFVMQVRKPE